jgi:hypothetical protein
MEDYTCPVAFNKHYDRLNLFSEIFRLSPDKFAKLYNYNLKEIKAAFLNYGFYGYGRYLRPKQRKQLFVEILNICEIEWYPWTDTCHHDPVTTSSTQEHGAACADSHRSKITK